MRRLIFPFLAAFAPAVAAPFNGQGISICRLSVFAQLTKSVDIAAAFLLRTASRASVAP